MFFVNLLKMMTFRLNAPLLIYYVQAWNTNFYNKHFMDAEVDVFLIQEEFFMAVTTSFHNSRLSSTLSI